MSKIIQSSGDLEESIKASQIIQGGFYQEFWHGGELIQIGWDGVGFVTKADEFDVPLSEVQINQMMPLVAFS